VNFSPRGSYLILKGTPPGADTQLVSIIRECVFEPFYAAVDDKPDGREHESSANEVHKVGPKHEHLNASFLFWIKIRFF